MGTWTGLAELWPSDTQNNFVSGDAYLQESQGNVVYVSGGPPVAVRGVNDLVIVSTPDGVLVIPKDRCEEVRHLVVHREDS